MSILWLEPFTFFKQDSNIFYFQNLNIIIYLNMISCICFVVYSMLYNMDKNMQRPPSKININLDTLIILKMFGECMVSLNLLICCLCYSFESNKRKTNKTETIVYLLSIISPCTVFLAYFFNACLAHNLYQTFYAYKNSYDKRLAVYKLIALFVSIGITLFSILFNDNVIDNEKFTLSYYKIFFLASFYILGGVLIAYIIQIIVYVMMRKDELFAYGDENDERRKELLNIFVNRTIYYLVVFIICFAPNNIIQLLQVFSSYKICDECPGLSFSGYLASLSCSFTFCLKFTEPYMLKYLRLIKNFVLRNEEKVNIILYHIK